jgi:hypothetical protein
MSKGLALLGAVATAVTIAVASAAATTPPPADLSTVHGLLVCLHSGSPGVIGGNGDRKGPITSTTDLYLTIGWGALRPSQINTFFANEYGSIVVSNYDETTNTIGSAVDTVSWGDKTLNKQTDTSLWTAPYAVNSPDQNNGKPFTRTDLYAHIGPLPSGTYWVAPDLELAKPTFDGSNTVSGAWDNTGCEMVVS